MSRVRIGTLSVKTSYHTTSCYAHFSIKHIPLCNKKCATVVRPSLLCAGDAIHPVPQKGVVWFTRLPRPHAAFLGRLGKSLVSTVAQTYPYPKIVVIVHSL